MVNLYSAFPPWGAQSALQIFPRQAIAFRKSFSTSWDATRCICRVALKHLHSYKFVHCPCASITQWYILWQGVGEWCVILCPFIATRKRGIDNLHQDKGLRLKLQLPKGLHKSFLRSITQSNQKITICMYIW